MTETWEPETGYEEVPGQFQRRQDIASERIVCGSIMQRPDLIDELAELFDPGDFTIERHAWVWHAVNDLRAEIPTGEISFIAVNTRLQAWRAAGRMPVAPPELVHLSQMYGEAMPASADYYAARVSRLAEANRLIELGIRAQQMGMSADFDTGDAIATAQVGLDAVVRNDTAGKPTRAAELLPAVFEEAVNPPNLDDRVPTGFTDLDSLTGGWAPGRLITVGARPGVGKTTLGLGFARAAAITHGLPTLFTSLEMSKEELGRSIVAAEATVALHHITGGICTSDQVRRMGLARDRIEAAPLFIDDATHVTLAHLRNRVRTLKRTDGLRLVVVDYLQLMQAPRAESRQVAVSQLARGLKLMAKEFAIPVIVLSQLNRLSEQRTDKRPTSSDLRESGAVEQDSDMVILVHRPDMHEPDSPRAGEVDLIVDKHRGGARSTITAAAQLHYARLVDMARDVEPERWTPHSAAEGEAA